MCFPVTKISFIRHYIYTYHQLELILKNPSSQFKEKEYFAKPLLGRKNYCGWNNYEMSYSV